jgi:CDP-glucose 4,6-dehydratase
MAKPVPIDTLRLFYRSKRVLVTGHTGFKGAWLALWLSRMGGQVFGFALAPDQGPDNLFERAAVASAVSSAEIDLRDASAIIAYMAEVRPQIVFHLAARAYVQQGYEDPLATFATNTLGTAHVLEAARRTPSVEAVVCVTTDKVYRNDAAHRPYRETDELGGLDPYSTSKAAAELVVRCYRHTLPPIERQWALATARGGNVIGGADWAPHRIIPDLVRAIRDRQPLRLRRPSATRPWQHVLDLSHAYLLLGYRLLDGTIKQDEIDSRVGQGWNFGPVPGREMTVAALVARFLETWGELDYPIEYVEPPHYETTKLCLDPSQAIQHLGWHSVLDGPATIEWTADWYRRYLQDATAARKLVDQQIERFESRHATEIPCDADPGQLAEVFARRQD